MRQLSTHTRSRLHIQGFENVSDESLAPVAPWLRFAFLTCALLAALGTITASTTLLGVLVVIAGFGALSPVHPVDYIYNYGIRRFTGTEMLPKRGTPSRFACGLGTVWLLTVIWMFESGNYALGYVFGGLLTSVATLVGTTDICIPSMIYRAIFGAPKPATNS